MNPHQTGNALVSEIVIGQRSIETYSNSLSIGAQADRIAVSHPPNANHFMQSTSNTKGFIGGVVKSRFKIETLKGGSVGFISIGYGVGSKPSGFPGVLVSLNFDDRQGRKITGNAPQDEEKEVHPPMNEKSARLHWGIAAC